jgi:hypothetical protein
MAARVTWLKNEYDSSPSNYDNSRSIYEACQHLQHLFSPTFPQNTKLFTNPVAKMHCILSLQTFCQLFPLIEFPLFLIGFLTVSTEPTLVQLSKINLLIENR